MSNNNRPSKRRYVAMLEDVEKRVRYATFSRDHANPYPVDDKRHDRFTRQLYRSLAVQADFEDMSDAMGDDRSKWKLRHYGKPGPVVPLDGLI